MLLGALYRLSACDRGEREGSGTMAYLHSQLYAYYSRSYLQVISRNRVLDGSKLVIPIQSNRRTECVIILFNSVGTQFGVRSVDIPASNEPIVLLSAQAKPHLGHYLRKSTGVYAS